MSMSFDITLLQNEMKARCGWLQKVHKPETHKKKKITRNEEKLERNFSLFVPVACQVGIFDGEKHEFTFNFFLFRYRFHYNIYFVTIFLDRVSVFYIFPLFFRPNTMYLFLSN